jgi:S-adenosylmethionine:tRNA ribosyltransferase-isomerase
MLTTEFDYDLPPDLIAQSPCAERDASRLLVLGRDTGSVEDHRFAELPALLPAGALLVLNDTRVIPARLRARKASGGQVEVLLVRAVAASGEASGPTWQCLTRSSKGLRAGITLDLPYPAPHAGVRSRVLSVGDDGAAELAFDPPTDRPADPGWFLPWLHAVGETPLPPYIRRDAGDLPGDRTRYQTVYARHPGSVAAPTAGLHFTEALLATLRAAGFETAYLTLHVGPGTFRPVRAEDVADHRMDGELVNVPPDVVAAIGRARAAGRPVVAVGTTTVRALEGAWSEADGLRHGEREVSVFIRPPYRFHVVDALVTNFHLPRSTLLMLVSALAGREPTLAAYRHAVAERYRFYSYGDAMLIR